MRGDITLGEVKARCAELTGKYGSDHCCHHCEFEKLGCCDPPDTWKVDELHRELTEQRDMVFPDWEALAREAKMKLSDVEEKARMTEMENQKLRAIVNAVETMLGRKFEVGV